MFAKVNPKIFLLCVLSIFVYTTNSYAQPPSIASLLVRLQSSKPDTSRVSVYRAIIINYRGSQPDSALFYAQQATSFCKKLNYTPGVALMEGQTGAIYMGMGKMSEAKKHLTTALSLFTALNNQSGLVSANNSMGVCLAKMGAFKEAAKYFVAALKINQANNNTYGLIQSYIKLGALNEQINNLDKSLEYYQKALELNKQQKDLFAESTLQNNIGIIYARKGSMKHALEYFLRSVETAGPQQLELKATALGNAGDAYQQLGDSKKAFDYQNESLAIARKLNAPEQEARTLVNLASLKIKTKPDTSLILLNQALHITKAIHHDLVRLDVYTVLTDVYKHQGNYKEAINAIEARDALKDSLFTLKSTKDIANLIATNDLANTKIKVQELQLSNARSEFGYWITLAVAISAVVVLLIVVLFYQKTRGLNKQLLVQQHELKALNNFKDKLFSMISHDLRSPVATIINLLGVLEAEEDIATMKTFIPRLKQHSESTLKVMDKLLLWGQSQLKGAVQNITNFNVKDVIVQCVHLHQETAERKKIMLIDKTPGRVLVNADASHVEFVFRNLIANAVKYTNAGGFVEINVKLNQPKGFNTFEIKDDGIGIDKSMQSKIFEPNNVSVEGTNSEKGNSIGLMLSKEFVERNGGSIRVESDLGRGTSFFVSLRSK